MAGVLASTKANEESKMSNTGTGKANSREVGGPSILTVSIWPSSKDDYTELRYFKTEVLKIFLQGIMILVMQKTCQQ